MTVKDVLKRIDKRLALSCDNFLLHWDSYDYRSNQFYMNPDDSKAQEIVAKINEKLSKFKFSFYYETDSKYCHLIPTPSYVERRSNITASFEVFKNDMLIEVKRYILKMVDENGQSVYSDAELFETASDVDDYIEDEKRSLNVKIDDYINELRSAYIYACTQLNKQ